MSQFTFAQVPTADIPRSAFNRSHGHKTTFNSGFLVPVYVDEVLPGDTFSVRMSAFARLNTPIVPVMDNMYLDVFFFHVPNRLLWDNWKKFMGEQVNPGDSTDYLVPQVNPPGGGWAASSLGDYFGLPVGAKSIASTALPFRAYNLIYNEWFRDENLINSVPVAKGDGPDDGSNATYPLRRRGKRHDYFTSCLPWPQKGTAVSLPIGTSAPVKSDGTAFKLTQLGVASPVTDQTFGLYNGTGISGAIGYNVAPTNTGGTLKFGINTGLYADLSTATAATINALRQAFQIQALLEKDARGGTRYTEIVRSHFGVVSPDARVQRPEYLGGGTIPVNINPVTQTSGTGSTGQATPQGNMSGYGVAAGSGIGFTKSFTEHGIVIGLVEVRADLSYQQGLPRWMSRRTRYDFYWPAFANLGEQAVLNKEVYCQNVPGTGAAQDDGVFGYQERWAEYRYAPSKITGLFRSDAAGTLNIWHLAQNFTALPTLNQTFIEDIPPVSRIVAVTTQPEFNFDSHFSIKCVRPMPTYSIPGLGGRF